MESPISVGDARPNGAYDYPLLHISGENTETVQKLQDETLEWDISFGQASLVSSAAFTMTGDELDDGLFYSHSQDHSNSKFSCVESSTRGSKQYPRRVTRCL